MIGGKTYSDYQLAWNPAAGVGSVSSNFGKATGDRGPRQIQYGLKINF